MIHYFNPGHETAVLNASKYYRPPASVAKMQEDLALLPAWYASPGDYVFDGCRVLGTGYTVHGARYRAEEQSSPRVPCTVHRAPVEFWGISPQSIHYFETLDKQYGLQLQIPEWKEEYRFLGSRFAAQKALASLIDAIPEIDKTILPQFYSDLEEIEKAIVPSPALPEGREKAAKPHCHPPFREGRGGYLQGSWLLKSPYSSSGRGLLWLPPGKLAQSERQIIGGMLKKQSQVSLEKALDKRLDFSMHFEITREGASRFIGYSVFRTNDKGAYESSLLAAQETMEKQITDLIDSHLLQKVKETLAGILHEMYAPHYAGNLGVDMLAYFYENQFLLHPCVEINMRKSMGYLAIRLFENHICRDSQGHFFVEYHKTPQTLNEKHFALQKQYPLQIENNRICSGYLSLCPVKETTNYLAYILLSSAF